MDSYTRYYNLDDVIQEEPFYRSLKRARRRDSYKLLVPFDQRTAAERWIAETEQVADRVFQRYFAIPKELREDGWISGWFSRSFSRMMYHAHQHARFYRKWMETDDPKYKELAIRHDAKKREYASEANESNDFGDEAACMFGRVLE